MAIEEIGKAKAPEAKKRPVTTGTFGSGVSVVRWMRSRDAKRARADPKLVISQRAVTAGAVHRDRNRLPGSGRSVVIGGTLSGK